MQGKLNPKSCNHAGHYIYIYPDITRRFIQPWNRLLSLLVHPGVLTSSEFRADPQSMIIILGCISQVSAVCYNPTVISMIVWGRSLAVFDVRLGQERLITSVGRAMNLQGLTLMCFMQVSGTTT